ncbi:hypothetical protein BJV82DRAFT_580228 [Fennellomyces sp. T-0311]|nr:hypothetical protein BJV82DRAFT_580228 [Fennellomyces sp. T-0311]
MRARASNADKAAELFSRYAQNLEIGTGKGRKASSSTTRDTDLAPAVTTSADAVVSKDDQRLTNPKSASSSSVELDTQDHTTKENSLTDKAIFVLVTKLAAAVLRVEDNQEGSMNDINKLQGQVDRLYQLLEKVLTTMDSQNLPVEKEEEIEEVGGFSYNFDMAGYYTNARDNSGGPKMKGKNQNDGEEQSDGEEESGGNGSDEDEPLRSKRSRKN